AKLLQNFVTIHPGHLDIAKDQIRLLIERQLQPLLAICRRQRLPAFKLDSLPYERKHFGSIFNDQNPLHPTLFKKNKPTVLACVRPCFRLLWRLESLAEKASLIDKTESRSFWASAF